MKTRTSGSVGYYRAKPLGNFEDFLDHYTPRKSTDGTWFGIFCIEKNEYFSPGSAYDVELNDGAESGGKSGAVNGKDIISKGTAWLYEQYALGTLTGLNHSSKSALQTLKHAIWYLEGEINYKNSISDMLDLAQNGLGLDLAGIKGNYNGHNVQVMNLTSASNRGATVRNQDQLVYTPVPDANSTLALLSFAVIGMFAIRRRIK